MTNVNNVQGGNNRGRIKKVGTVTKAAIIALCATVLVGIGILIKKILEILQTPPPPILVPFAVYALKKGWDFIKGKIG